MTTITIHTCTQPHSVIPFITHFLCTRSDMVLDTVGKKVSQTMSQTFWEAFGAPAPEIRYRVFCIPVLANARKIGLFLFS